MKRSPLKRTYGFRRRAHTEPINAPCALCGTWGTMDRHHLVPARVVHEHCVTLGWDPEPWLVDSRNLVNLHRGCHERVERRKAYVRLPELAWEFAADLGVTYWLERYERQAAA